MARHTDTSHIWGNAPVQFKSNLCNGAHMIDLPKDLLDLDHASMERLGNWFSIMASVCADRAGNLRQIASREARCEARTDFLREAGPRVLHKLQQRYNSRESAVEAVAREMNVPAFTVEAQFRAFLKSKKREDMEARRKLVISLVRVPMSNAEIAAHIGVHRNTISSIISAHLFPDMRPCDRMRYRKRRKEKRPE